MTLEEIIALEPEARIDELKKGRTVKLPDVKSCVKALDPKLHDVFDTALRPDKPIKDGDTITRTESVARIAIAMQESIVKKAVSFIFGNPVELTLKSEDATDKKIFEAVKDILTDVKINSLNRRVAKALFSCTEVAELWYPQEIKSEEEALYGIESKFKLRMKILNPLDGEELYPYFDDYGDMIVFSRKYSVTKGDKVTTYFEVYTDEQIDKYDISDGKPVQVENFPVKNEIGKIPIIYGRQKKTDYDDVQGMIDRLEKLLSNFADTNDYHSAPTIFIRGKVIGFSKKGESGKIIEGEKDSEAQYLSWTNAPEAVRLEITTLLNLISMISQTPDVSFENIKSIGSSISGKALELLFMDAHLKVQDHMEVFDEYLQRRHSVIKAFIGSFNSSLKKSVRNTKIDFEVIPYMITDETAGIDFIMTANGNKPVISQKTAIKMSNLVENVEDELKQIQEEEEASNVTELFPTGK